MSVSDLKFGQLLGSMPSHEQPHCLECIVQARDSVKSVLRFVFVEVEILCKAFYRHFQEFDNFYKSLNKFILKNE